MKAEEAIAIIEKIEAVDLTKETAYSELLDIFHNTEFGIFGFDLSYHPDLFYCRARIMKNVDDYYESIGNHSYNPFPQYISQGRANEPGQQMFYLGRTRITALAEVNIIENQKEKALVSYGISRWQPIKQMKIASIIDLESFVQINADELDGFKKFVLESIEKINAEAPGLLLLYKYFGSKFRELIVAVGEHKYKITCALTNTILKKNPQMIGVMYQSVKHPDSYNLALKKEAVDEYYFKPTVFVKNIYERENITELNEIGREMSKSFNESNHKIEWDYSLKKNRNQILT